jgi:erythritol kinase (D-erythritol 1-phosphate-forming)
VLAWLREHEPRALDGAATVLCCKDWLRLELTGEVASETSDASYVPCDIRARGWSRELLALCGVAAEEPLLPELRGEDHVAPLRADRAEQAGLAPGTPVAMGLTDIVSGTLGGGCIRPGHGVTVLGTSAVSTIVADEPLLEPAVVGLNACAPLGRWARTMVNTSGSMTLDWTARLLCGGDVGQLAALAEEAAEIADAVTFVPYLSNAGVVAPFAEPSARAVIAGLRVDHGPAEVARAAFEGLAVAVAEGYAAMPVEVREIVAVGGAARSDLLLQAIADHTGCVVHRLAGEAAGARAVALMAGRAAGLLGSDAELESAVEARDVVRSFEPEPERRAALAERYRATVSATRDLWPRWR